MSVVHLTERRPALTAAEMVAQLAPPPQFRDASFENYRADDAYPSQAEAKQVLTAFCGSGIAKVKGGLFSRKPKAPATKPGVYLDGGLSLIHI